MQLTARQAYIDILTELVKEEAPTLYLEDYLYYFNKAISEYMKTRYEVFETNQQLADDMRSWKKSQASSLETQQYIQKYTGHSSEDRRIQTPFELHYRRSY
jgi:hypothetical protein